MKLIRKEVNHEIRIFRSDNGTEFINDELKKFFDEMGIHQQRTVPYTPEQNGCAEREMRTIVESARTMIHSKKIGKKFWAEAVAMATHVLNRTGTSTIDGKSPYELWYGKQPKIDHLRAFGCEVFVHIPKEKRQKFDAKSIKCLFVGYDNHAKAYRVWNPKTNKMQVARDVVFMLEESTAILNLNDGDDHIDEVGDDLTSEPSVTSDDEKTPNQPMRRGAICELDKRNVIPNRLRNRENI